MSSTWLMQFQFRFKSVIEFITNIYSLSLTPPSIKRNTHTAYCRRPHYPLEQWVNRSRSVKRNNNHSPFNPRNSKPSPPVFCSHLSGSFIFISAIYYHSRVPSFHIHSPFERYIKTREGFWWVMMMHWVHSLRTLFTIIG